MDKDTAASHLAADFPTAAPASIDLLAALQAAVNTARAHPQPSFGNGWEPELHDPDTHPAEADWAAEREARRYF